MNDNDRFHYTPTSRMERQQLEARRAGSLPTDVSRFRWPEVVRPPHDMVDEAEYFSLADEIDAERYLQVTAEVEARYRAISLDEALDLPLVTELSPHGRSSFYEGLDPYTEADHEGESRMTQRNLRITSEMLGPCPFCNKSVAIVDQSDDLEVPPAWRIVCDYNKDGCGGSGGYRSSALEAMKVWKYRNQTSSHLSDRELKIIADFFQYQFDPIGFTHSELTETEQQICSEEEFQQLLRKFYDLMPEETA